VGIEPADGRAHADPPNPATVGNAEALANAQPNANTLTFADAETDADADTRPNADAGPSPYLATNRRGRHRDGRCLAARRSAAGRRLN
jgi:hypothetical protein